MAYYRGDYYRGDYYRGDPGLFSFLGKAAKAVTGVVSKLGIPGVSSVAGLAHGVLSGGKVQVVPQISPPMFPLQQAGLINVGQGPQTGLINIGGGGGILPEQQGPVGTMLPGGFIPGMCGMKGTRVNKSSYYRRIPGTLQGQLIPKGSVCVKTRRMNIANGRALTRAVRRAQGFAKMARRVLAFTSPKAPKGKAYFRKRKR